MKFIPGQNSPLDSSAGGKATYNEIIPAIYANYILDSKMWQAELGLRTEYVKINYVVAPGHPVYKSNGYNYLQPFPNVRLAYKINSNNKLSLFYNRRVDRPNEVDIRIFPKYDDAEIIKVGNPALRPQFTNSFELAYKTSWNSGYFYSSAYLRMADATITRISTTIPNSTLIYAIFQNLGKSRISGIETVLEQKMSSQYSFNLSATIYHNYIDAFTVENLYPVAHTFSAAKQEIVSGNVKMNNNFKLKNNLQIQVTLLYLAPDIIPQGKIEQRFSFDFGIKKSIRKGKGELIISATDLFNTLVIKKEIQGNGFHYTSADYNETQRIRLGYNYNF
ncbi:MAG: outer membrane beta-barrel family protein [Bacteroidia bacterium]